MEEQPTDLMVPRARENRLAVATLPELPATVEANTAIATTEPLACRPVTEEQAATLLQIIPDEDHDILPTGEVYVTQVRYRRILNEAFGPAGWALRPASKLFAQGSTLIRQYELWAEGRFVSDAIGEAEYIASNARMTYASAAEAVKSSALVRCCKDLGIASECWDHRWAEAFKQAHCIQVWVQGKKQPLWRRKDAAPFFGETGPVGDRDPNPAPPRSAAAGWSQPQASTGEPRRISEKQQKRMYAIGKNAGHADRDVKDWLASEYGWNSSAEVLVEEYEAICIRLANPESLAFDQDDPPYEDEGPH